MDRRFARSLLTGAAASLACIASASACHVQLSWSAQNDIHHVVLQAEYASSTPVTADTYGALGGAGELTSLQLTMSDRADGAQVAYLDLQIALQTQSQLLALLSDIAKDLADIHMSVVRNVGGRVVGSAFDSEAATDAPYSLALSSSRQGFETIYLALDCQGDCEGEYSSSFAFDRYVPEPSSRTLALTALALSSLAGLQRLMPRASDRLSRDS